MEDAEDASCSLLCSSIFTVIICVIIHTLLSIKGNRGEEVHRQCKDLEKDLFEHLGDGLFWCAYQMEKDSFYHLHGILQDGLEKQFFPKQGETRWFLTNPYFIKTEIRLSVALRYFAGESPVDLVVTHGISYTSVFTSIWGVVDVINNHPHLKIQFPNHKQQKTISEGFKSMSGAGFDTVIGAIDGILIWVLKPSKVKCKAQKHIEKAFSVPERINLVSTCRPYVIINCALHG
jgi:hypothetical protein